MNHLLKNECPKRKKNKPTFLFKDRKNANETYLEQKHVACTTILCARLLFFHERWESKATHLFEHFWPFELSHFLSLFVSRSQRRNKLNNLSIILYIRNETKWAIKREMRNEKRKSNRMPYRNKLQINNISCSESAPNKVFGFQFLYLLELVLEFGRRHLK